jgi:putative hemolysin
MERANSFYAQVRGLPSDQFIDALFERMHLRVEWNAEDLERIPAEGPFWLIANHPMGMWDGMIMMKILKERRPEFKVITMFFLERLAELRPHIIPVNNWNDKRDLRVNTKPMREILGTLTQEGNPVALFPGGSVSRFILRRGRVTDPEWNPTSIKMMEKVEVPILPMFIEGGNSRWFYTLSFLSATLRRGRNFGEFFNKRGKTVRIHIGEAITPAMRKDWTTEQFGQQLRKSVYDLGHLPA